MFTRGRVTLVFDDGYERVYQNAVPLLNKYRIPGVFAIPLNAPALEEQRKVKPRHFAKLRPYQQWLPIQEQGHEIASHSATHPNLTKLNSQQLDQELAEPKRILKAKTIIYPGGAWNETVVSAASKYYQYGRTISRGFESIPPKHKLVLRQFNYTRDNFTPLKANLRALWAYFTNQWLIETYHMVDPDDQQMVHTVTPKALAKHLAFLRWLPIKATTFKQLEP